MTEDGGVEWGSGGPRGLSRSGYMEGRGLASRPRGWSSVHQARCKIPAANGSAPAPTPGFYKDVLAAGVYKGLSVKANLTLGGTVAKGFMVFLYVVIDFR